jgi:Fe-S-cluster containining protein
MCENIRMPADTEPYTRKQLDVLENIYALHDSLTARMGLACRAGCDLCCTRNVSVTTLEAGLIARHLEKTGQPALLEKIAESQDRPRFQPLTTTNTLAHLCRTGQMPPEETCDPSWRPCPLLTDHRCPIYTARPFACRCMVSTSVCRPGGQAEMEDYQLTLQTVFMQFIEHADATGCTGNLIDLLPLRPVGGRCAKHGFVPNRPIEMLLLPPEHQARGQKIVADLSALFQ